MCTNVEKIIITTDDCSLDADPTIEEGLIMECATPSEITLNNYEEDVEVAKETDEEMENNEPATKKRKI